MYNGTQVILRKFHINAIHSIETIVIPARSSATRSWMTRILAENKTPVSMLQGTRRHVCLFISFARCTSDRETNQMEFSGVRSKNARCLESFITSQSGYGGVFSRIVQLPNMSSTNFWGGKQGGLEDYEEEVSCVFHF